MSSNQQIHLFDGFYDVEIFMSELSATLRHA